VVCHDQKLHLDANPATLPDPQVLLRDPNGGTSVLYDGTGASLEPFCVNCHDADGVGGDLTPFADGVVVPNVKGNAAGGWPGSAHKSASYLGGNVTCVGDGGRGCHAGGHGSANTGAADLAQPTSAASIVPGSTLGRRQRFAIGGHPDGTGQFFQGRIDDANVWNVTREYADTKGPVLAILSPANGAKGVSPNALLSFVLSDADLGVDWPTFKIGLAGTKGYAASYSAADTGQVTATGTKASYQVLVDPVPSFGEAETITATVEVRDLGGNPIAPVPWSFTSSSVAGYWSFNELAGDTAHDLNGNDGILEPTFPSDSPTWIAGKGGGALGFDATNDRVRCVSGPAYERTMPFSIEAWVRFNDTGTMRMIVTKMAEAQPYRGIQLYRGTDNYLYVALIDRFDTNPRLYVRRASASTLTSGVWRHVVATYDGSSTTAGLLLYVNGAVSNGVADSPGPISTILTSEPWRFGSRGAGGYALNGSLDEVFIHNRALAAAEILARYQAGGP
jgi:hypothetical protein